jgi:hypothetical protein
MDLRQKVRVDIPLSNARRLVRYWKGNVSTMKTSCFTTWLFGRPLIHREFAWDDGNDWIVI